MINFHEEDAKHSLMRYMDITEDGELSWILYDIRKIMGEYQAPEKCNCKKHYLIYKPDTKLKKYTFEFSKTIDTIELYSVGSPGHEYLEEVPSKEHIRYYRDFYYGIFECRECGEKLLYISKKNYPCENDGVMIRTLKYSFEVTDNYHFIDFSSIETNLHVYHRFEYDEIDEYINNIINQYGPSEELYEYILVLTEEMRDRIKKCPKLIKRNQELEDFRRYLI